MRWRSTRCRWVRHIEARQVDGAPQWQDALARFNTVALTVSHRGRGVWNTPRIVLWDRVLDVRQPCSAIYLDGGEP